MSKSSGETFSFPSASHSTHVYESFHCGASKFNEQTVKDVMQNNHHVIRLVDGFNSSFDRGFEECESFNYSQIRDGINTNHFLSQSLEGVNFKESVHSNEEKAALSENLRECKYLNSNMNCVLDSICNDDSMNMIVQEPTCNGTISRPSSNSTLPSPVSKSDSSTDVNGCTKSLISPNFEVDRIKMNLEKLDETIDYVLAFARSDDPCEDMFILPCRLRDSSHLSSPSMRANTPSSGALASPALSPAPSPHSSQINTSVAVHTCKTQSSFQSSNLCNKISSQPLQHYLVDSTHGLLHFSSNASSQCAPTPYANQTVSFVQLCSDSSNSSLLHCSQTHFVSQITQPLNSRVVLHPGVLHNIQNYTGQQTNFAVPQTTMSVASVQRVNTPVASPNKGNLSNNIYKTVSSDVSILTRPSIVPAPYTQQKISNALSLNQSNVCLLKPSVQSSQSLLFGSINTVPSNGYDGKHTFLSPANGDKKLGLTMFRQPTVPVNSISNTVLTVHGVNNQTSSVVNDQSFLGAQSVSMSRKRSNTNVTASNKRRKASVSIINNTSATVTTNVSTLKSVSEVNVNSNRFGQTVAHCFEKLKSTDVKSLVSAPVLEQYVSVLSPVFASECISFFDVDDEEEFICQKGLKYSRGALAVGLPLCLYSCKIDSYLSQHLKENVPLGPIIRSKSCKVLTSLSSSVRASPEPLSFENNMKALFSKIHQFSKKEDDYFENKKVNDLPKLEVDVESTNSLLNMFSHSPSCAIGKLDVDRCTPPLPLQHIPNPRLLHQIKHSNIDKEKQLLDVKPDNKLLSTTIKSESILLNSNVPSSVNGLTEVSDGFSSSSLLIDSETGEALVCHNSNNILSNNSEFNLTENEKLHITFTINPSTTVSIPKIIRRITDLLGIEKDSVVCQITRSGAQITLDQKQQQSEFVMRNLETHLRQQFTPLSLHFEKESVNHSNFESQSTDSLLVASSAQSARQSKVESNISPKLENTYNLDNEIQRYPEEPVSLISLLANKHRIVNKLCKNCDKLVPPYLVQRKWYEELINVTGINVKLENILDFVFCSNDCLVSYSKVFSNRLKYLDTVNVTQTSELRTNNTDVHKPLVVCDLPCSVPVVLQNGPPRSKSINLKRQCTSQSASIPNKRRATGTSVLTRYRKWRGVRWRFGAHPNQQVGKCSEDSVHNHSNLLRVCSDDTRVCVLCSLAGDALDNGSGRLVPLDLDRWVHVNCALWCFEVYETVGGSLNNVDLYLDKALETICSHCGNYGAGLPCYNPKCTFVYHVPCAVDTGCMFFTDRGMYCSQHQPKEFHPMQLPSLTVTRRVYVSRDENRLIAQIVHEEDRNHVVRLGSVCLYSIGQLLPHQIDSGYFHTRRNIYPVGLCTSRIYWSMRKPLHRAKYFCKILEKNNRPLFQVTAVDVGMENEILTHETCDGVWQIILCRIQSLRKDHKLIKVFPQHLKGEHLYGLSEPHIIRTIESLPGVDGLRDYVFNFGRLELISEMPLAINPSGCARSEPKMQTYVKRFRSDSTDCSTVNHRFSGFPGIRKLFYPGLSVNGHSITDGSIAKQYQNSRSQQYRRLKAEVNANVILGRSRIQGLGLFAARDLEDQTMVIEYIGELIRSELANKREKRYEAHNKGIYMFRLDENLVIDATVCGGVARYINHSCQPNCYAEHISFVDHSHIVIITNRRIKKGEELCYDYNFDLDDRGDKIPCLCGAPNCRKWMN